MGGKVTSTLDDFKYQCGNIVWCQSTFIVKNDVNNPHPIERNERRVTPKGDTPAHFPRRLQQKKAAYSLGLIYFYTTYIYNSNNVTFIIYNPKSLTECYTKTKVTST